MVTGMALFTLNDAMGKWLVESCPVPLILAVRSAAALLILLPLVLKAGVLNVFKVPAPGYHLLRIVLIVFGDRVGEVDRNGDLAHQRQRNSDAGTDGGADGADFEIALVEYTATLQGSDFVL